MKPVTVTVPLVLPNEYLVTVLSSILKTLRTVILLCRPGLIPGEPLSAFLFSICFLHHERPLEKLARFLSVRGPWSILPHFTASEIKMF